MTSRLSPKRKSIKGTAKQRELANLFIAHGWKVHVTHRSPKIIGRLPNGQPKWISARNDIYGCFDLVASKAGLCLWLDVTDEHDRWKGEKEMAPLRADIGGFCGMATYLDGQRGVFNLWDYTGKLLLGDVSKAGVRAVKSFKAHVKIPRTWKQSWVHPGGWEAP